MRAIGRPDWMVWIVALQAERTSGNEQVPAEIASGNAREAERDLDDDAERALRRRRRDG